jgi:hypothetical protein
MGGLAAAVAELRGLEAEADLRRSALARRIDFARRQVEDLKARTNVWTANPLNLAGRRAARAGPAAEDEQGGL